MKSQLDIHLVQRRLKQSSKTYADHAVMQREITSRALERLDYIKQQPRQILDLSVHPQDSEQQLRRCFPKAKIQPLRRGWFKKSNLDISPFEPLALDADSIDFIFMSLTLLWINDWPALLRDCYRVLRPNGMLLFTTLGPDSLCELRQACAAIDDYPHVHAFVDMHHLGDALPQTGFENPVMDVERVEMQYRDLSQLVTDLRLTGCQNAHLDRRRSLMTPRQWAQIDKHYQKTNAQQLCASFEFVYGHAWIGKQKRQLVHQETQEVMVPLSNLISK